MKDKDREQGEIDLAHAEGRMMAIQPHVEARSVKKDRVRGNEDDEGNAIAIKILGAPIVAIRIEVDHVGRYTGLMVP